MAKTPAQTAVLVAALAASAAAQIDVGSDGSDGPLNCQTLAGDDFFDCAVSCTAPSPCEFTIDLALAAGGNMCGKTGDQPCDVCGGTGDQPCTWDAQSPVEGQGVYDAKQWAVVFKYTSIDIPKNVTVKFSNHPSAAPVVWLVDGDVVVAGTISLNGDQGHENISAEPGPGGFRGGRGSSVGSSGAGGFGPGGGGRGSNSAGRGGSYSTVGTAGQGGNGSAGSIYGNTAILPLVGGSGGAGGHAASGSSTGGGGGGSGGAILIAARTSFVLTGTVSAKGGNGSLCCGAYFGGGGSGGAIRIIADMIEGPGVLRALPGVGFDCPAGCLGGGIGGLGRIRVEGNTVSLVDPGDPSYVQDLPTFVFPPAGTPRVKATLLEDSGMTMHAVPFDPKSVITDNTMTDVNIATTDAVTINIEAENVPAGTCVDIRVVAKSGPTQIVKSSPLVDAGGGLLTATADVTFDPGFSVVQLRANFADGITGCALLPKHLRGLKTLNGERIVRLAVGGAMGRGSQTIYITETGRKIPVGQ